MGIRLRNRELASCGSCTAYLSHSKPLCSICGKWGPWQKNGQREARWLLAWPGDGWKWFTGFNTETETVVLRRLLLLGLTLLGKDSEFHETESCRIC